MHRFPKILIIILLFAAGVQPQNVIDLNLDTAIEIAMNNSYRTKRLKIEIERGILFLKARKASLHTQIGMKMKSPDLQNISEYKWNSELKKDEIVRVNTALWQSDLAVRQPLILLGYPTNGYLSLNYQLYQYSQRDVDLRQRDLYNRLYFQFEQPLFLPNELKNDLEEAELNLQDIKLDYVNERLQIIDDIADDYFDLFQLIHQDLIYKKQFRLLQQISIQSDSAFAAQTARHIEKTQLDLELTNVKESLLANQSEIREDLADMKQRLRLSREDSLTVTPEISIKAIDVNLEAAMQLGLDNHPYLQQLHINKRRSEIDVESAKADNAFHMSIEMTYGLEKQNHQVSNLWEDLDNSKSLTLNAYMPLWDGGVRSNTIQAEKLDVSRRILDIEEQREEIRKEISNAYTNLKEFYQRAMNMQQSVELSQNIAEASAQQYLQEQISLQDLLQILNRNRDTEIKFLNVYLDYRRALVTLITQTCFDFEKNRSLLEAMDWADAK